MKLDPLTVGLSIAWVGSGVKIIQNYPSFTFMYHFIGVENMNTKGPCMVRALTSEGQSCSAWREHFWANKRTLDLFPWQFGVRVVVLGHYRAVWKCEYCRGLGILNA